MTPDTPLLRARAPHEVVVVLVALVAALLVGPLGPQPARAGDAAASTPTSTPTSAPTSVRGWSTTSWTVPRGRVARAAVRVRTGDRWVARRAVLQFRPAGGRWTRVDADRTRRDGRVVLSWTVRRSGAVRVRVPATRTARAATTRGRWVTAAASGGSTTSGSGPSSAPTSTDAVDGRADRFESAVFRLVNDLRAQGTRCGSSWMAPVPPVARHARLDAAASDYAGRLAREDFFSHVDPQGRDAGDRAEAAGYRWSRIGENLAAGQDTPGSVVQAWRASPDHCRVMMGSWVHLGVGFVHDDHSTYGEHWVQLFGVPRG